MVTRNDKADEGLASLQPSVQAMIDAGVMSQYTQPGGVAFNDEIATFLVRFEQHILAQVPTAGPATDSVARSLAQKALDTLTKIKNAI